MTVKAGVLGRFAPSPTGRMHLGNIAAAVAAWAASHGNMLLRIEDIDTPRVRKDADKWIMDDLHWLGLDWVGEPVYQSQRVDLYEEALRALPVYPCTCTRKQIRAVAAPQEGDGVVVYPGTCRPASLQQCHYGMQLPHSDSAPSRHNNLGNCQDSKSTSYQGIRHSWRLALPTEDDPLDIVEFNDAYCGPQRVVLSKELGDTIMRRSDGVYAYHLAVTVDDALQGVTQVVRGRDLLRSAALQLHIRHILQGADVLQPAADPEFAHIGIMRAADGVRMAKRLNSIDMGEIRASGIHPEQVLGWIACQFGLIDSDHSTSIEHIFSYGMSTDRLQQIWNSVDQTQFATDMVISTDTWDVNP